MKPRHTKIIESIITEHGVLIREDYRNYPDDESNLYLTTPSGEIIWFAERKFQNDLYANPVKLVASDIVHCFTVRGLECEISLHSGRLLSTELVR